VALLSGKWKQFVLDNCKDELCEIYLNLLCSIKYAIIVIYATTFAGTQKNGSSSKTHFVTIHYRYFKWCIRSISNEYSCNSVSALCYQVNARFILMLLFILTGKFSPAVIVINAATKQHNIRLR